jgi:membrane-bound serine protease (ClpP class)
MDFLLDPNIAYLFLLGGALFAMLALITPGTGFFEVISFFCMAIAGYAVYMLLFNIWALILVALSVGVFVVAIQKPKRGLFLFLSIALLMVGSVFLFARDGGSPAVNPLLASFASTFVASFLWVAARKSLDAAIARPSHDLESLLGQVGEARTDVHGEGSVQLDGELWSAKSESLIPVGAKIRVVRRDGFIVVVESADTSN